jgi:hypothetical protein
VVHTADDTEPEFPVPELSAAVAPTPSSKEYDATGPTGAEADEGVAVACAARTPPVVAKRRVKASASQPVTVRGEK